MPPEFQIAEVDEDDDSIEHEIQEADNSGRRRAVLRKDLNATSDDSKKWIELQCNVFESSLKVYLKNENAKDLQASWMR